MKKEERKLEVECCNIARKCGGGCSITFCSLAKYRLAQTFKFSTKACGGILPNHCYKPFLFVFGVTI